MDEWCPQANDSCHAASHGRIAHGVKGHVASVTVGHDESFGIIRDGVGEELPLQLLARLQSMSMAVVEAGSQETTPDEALEQHLA